MSSNLESVKEGVRHSVRESQDSQSDYELLRDSIEQFIKAQKSVNIVFEVTAAGFDADTDETDDLVFWVSAKTQEDVELAIQDTGAKLCGELSDVCLADVDFELPAQSLTFCSVLLEKASDLRNKNRHVDSCSPGAK